MGKCFAANVMSIVSRREAPGLEGIGVEWYPWVARLLEQVLLHDGELRVLVEPFPLLDVLGPEAVLDVFVRDVRKLLHRCVSPVLESSRRACSPLAGKRRRSAAPQDPRSAPAGWRCAS